MAESCICVLAYPGHRRTTIKPENDQIVVEISITIGAVSKTPVRKSSPKIHYSHTKVFHLSRHAFLSSNQAEKQGMIVSNMIKRLDIPFQLENNILWGTLNFPENHQTVFSTLDEIESNLLDIASRCAESNITHSMDVHIRKIEKLSAEDYQKMSNVDHDVKKKEKQGPLDDWIITNSNNSNLSWIMRLIYKLGLESPRDNKFFGLKSVTIKEEQDDEGCSICMNGLSKNTVAIRMPCSHVFHGYCIFRWIAANPSCPFCRFELYNVSIIRGVEY